MAQRVECPARFNQIANDIDGSVLGEIGDGPRRFLLDLVLVVADAVDHEGDEARIKNVLDLFGRAADCVRDDPQRFLANLPGRVDAEAVLKVVDDLPLEDEVRRVVFRGVVAERAEAGQDELFFSRLELADDGLDEAGIVDSTKAFESAV